VPEATSLRSFIAVDLETPVLDALRTLQSELARTGADVRWVRPANMHVTLKFLGAVEPARLERVHAALRDAVSDQAVLRLRAHGLGAFPSLRRPRVVWAGLVGDNLAALAGRVDVALEPLGFAAEQRAFTPHVTLGRVNGMRGWARLEEMLKAHIDDDWGATVIDAVIIYRSTLHRDGAVYLPLWTIWLGRNKKDADEFRR
jgi:RNA 2',3'-cyclic 3'-phosphodiesterase